MKIYDRIVKKVYKDCSVDKISKQAGVELCQAQAKLEVVVEIGVEFGVEVEACHF